MSILLVIITCNEIHVSPLKIPVNATLEVNQVIVSTDGQIPLKYKSKHFMQVNVSTKNGTVINIKVHVINWEKIVSFSYDIHIK